MLVFAVLFFIVVFFILFLFLIRVFNTRPVPYDSNPADLGIPYETVRFPTRRNLYLHGWWIPASDGRNRPTVVLLHGWRRNAARMLPYVEALHTRFNLFVFDSRNHGKSDSDDFSSMPRFSEDILASLDYLQKERSLAYSGAIGLLGLSMGGAAAIHAASFDPRIRSVVTVGAFADPGEVMRLEYRKRHIPYYPLVYLVFEYFQFRIGQRFSQFAPLHRIGNSAARFLLIHGTDDQTAPFEQAERLEQAAVKNNAVLWAIRGAGHSNCHEFPGYWEKIAQFYSDTLE